MGTKYVRAKFTVRECNAVIDVLEVINVLEDIEDQRSLSRYTRSGLNKLYDALTVPGRKATGRPFQKGVRYPTGIAPVKDTASEVANG